MRTLNTGEGTGYLRCRYVRSHCIVISVDRWSLFRGALVQLNWAMNQSTVASVYRWSLYASGLTGFPVLNDILFVHSRSVTT